ncbi:MAG TPA: glycosyltransferase family 4 protein [Acidobacteriota bacterium]|nr:glycosyltransferase family 4 protein [Acidobacteriota bacterium]
MSGSGDSRRLKILHIDPERNWGGGETQVFGLLSCLTAKEHRNELLADPQGPLFARCASLDLQRRPIVIRNDLDLRCVPAVRRLIRTGKYDVVHLHTKRAHALSLWLPRYRSRPKYVVTRRMDYPERRNYYTDCLYNRRVDGVVAISRSIADLLITAGVDENRIRVIPSGIDPSRFGAISPGRLGTKDKFVIGCVGVLEERKGQRYLLEAAAALKQQGLRLECLFAGEGSLRQQLEREAARFGLEHDVRFVGFVADAAAFLANIDLFVMPSLFEGLGVAALEAMAAGKPVIASRVGGLAESVLDGVTGILVAPRDGAGLANAMATLIREPARAMDMGIQGRARVLQHFTLAQMARANEAYYYDLLGFSN